MFSLGRSPVHTRTRGGPVNNELYNFLLAANRKDKMIEETITLKVKAKFSDDRKFRFYLDKVWDESKPKALFILMNPSKATCLKLDNTLCNIMNYCIEAGYGQMRLVNLFPLMAISQTELSGKLQLKKLENNAEITASVEFANTIYVAWGTEDKYKTRKSEVEQILFDNQRGQIRCWKDKNGQYPKHLRIMSENWILTDYIFKYIKTETT